MTAQEECAKLLKYGILVRESMETLATEHGNVEEPFIKELREVVEGSSPKTALQAIRFSSQIAVRLESELIKQEVEQLSAEFEEQHTRCDVCGDIVHKSDAEEHIESHGGVDDGG